MKKLLCLLALLALAPVAARAQSGGNPYAPSAQTQQNQAANEATRQRYLNDAQQAQRTNQTDNSYSGGGGINYREYFPTREQRQRNQVARENKRARRADYKAHGKTHSYPGGYRGDKHGKMIAPDGTVISPGRKGK